MALIFLNLPRVTAYPAQLLEPTFLMPRMLGPAATPSEEGSAAGIIGCGSGTPAAGPAAEWCEVAWAAAYGALNAAAEAASVSAATAVPVTR